MEHNTQSLEDIAKQVSIDMSAGLIVFKSAPQYAEEVAKRYAELQSKNLTEEREETIKMLRIICKDHGDLDWQDNLHLTDIIDKHLGKHLDSADRTDSKPKTEDGMQTIAVKLIPGDFVWAMVNDKPVKTMVWFSQYVKNRCQFYVVGSFLPKNESQLFATKEALIQSL